MKIAFFGTPEFAWDILSWILEYPEIEVVLVVSQPDKAIWRKKQLQATAVKQVALENGIVVMQPQKLKITQSWVLSLPEEKAAAEFLRTTENFHETLKNLELDFIVVVAYGKIIPKEILDIPKYGCINIHGSILPKYRWASPVQSAVQSGDSETGLTIMYMSEGMDEGDMLQIAKVPIGPNDTSLDIFQKFIQVWPELLIDTLKKVQNWELEWIPQNESEATYCGKISREDGEIFFQKQSAQEIYNTYRAYTPWPGIYTWYEGKRLVLEEVIPLSQPFPQGEKGVTTNGISEASSLPWGENWEGEGKFLKLAKNRYGIVCSDWEVLEILKVKLEGKKSMDAMSFVNGNREVLGYWFQ